MDSRPGPSSPCGSEVRAALDRLLELWAAEVARRLAAESPPPPAPTSQGAARPPSPSSPSGR